MNVFEPTWDTEVSRPPYAWRRSRIGRQAGCQELGASLFEVLPGASTFPLHAHHANEELIIVLAGSLVLRTLESERELRPGDVIACPKGRPGAHRLDNRSADPARVLVISTMHSPDINEFPDSGILWARNYAPGSEPPDQAAAAELTSTPAQLDPLTLP